MIMKLKCKRLLAVKENEKTLKGTRNPVLIRKHGINHYFKITGRSVNLIVSIYFSFLVLLELNRYQNYFHHLSCNLTHWIQINTKNRIKKKAHNAKNLCDVWFLHSFVSTEKNTSQKVIQFF